MTDVRKNLRAALENGKVVFGMRESVKAMRKGLVKEVVCARNCPENIKNNVLTTSKTIGVQEFDGNSVELGIFCGRPFAVAVLAIAN